MEMTPELKALIGDAVKEALAPLTKVEERKTKAFGDPNPDPPVIQVKTVADDRAPEPGIRFARAVRAMAQAKQEGRSASYIAEHRMHDPYVAKALSEGTNSEGGYLVPEQWSTEFIDLLRATAVVRKAGATIMPMATDTLLVPKLTTGATAAYVGENANVEYEDQAFGQMSLSAKKLSVLTAMSNELLRDSNPAADRIVRDDLLASMALKEDSQFIRGTGSATAPSSIKTLATTNDFAITHAAAAATTAEVITDLGKAVRKVRAANARFIRPAWLVSPRTEWHLKTLMDANSNRVFWDEMGQGRLFGYAYYVTTQIPETLGGGDETEVYFGDFAEAVIGQKQGVEVSVSSEAAYYNGSAIVAAFSLDQTVIRLLARHDFNLRWETAFASITAVDWGA